MVSFAKAESSVDVSSVDSSTTVPDVSVASGAEGLVESPVLATEEKIAITRRAPGIMKRFFAYQGRIAFALALAALTSAFVSFALLAVYMYFPSKSLCDLSREI